MGHECALGLHSSHRYPKCTKNRARLRGAALPYADDALALWSSLQVRAHLTPAGAARTFLRVSRPACRSDPTVAGSRLWFALLAGLLAGACTVKGLDPEKERKAALEPHIAGYLAEDGLRDVSERGPGYVKGKIVIVDRAKRAVEAGSLWVPAEIRADDDGEVGTIVWLEYGERPGNPYRVEETGQVLNSVVQTCSVTVIDRAAREIVAKATVAGKQRDFAKVSAEGAAAGGSLVGERPVQAIVDFLSALPRR